MRSRAGCTLAPRGLKARLGLCWWVRSRGSQGCTACKHSARGEARSSSASAGGLSPANASGSLLDSSGKPGGGTRNPLRPCQPTARQGTGCLTPSWPRASILGAQPTHREEDFGPHPFSHRRLTWKSLTVIRGWMKRNLDRLHSCRPSLPHTNTSSPRSRLRVQQRGGQPTAGSKPGLQTISWPLPTAAGHVAPAGFP